MHQIMRRLGLALAQLANRIVPKDESRMEFVSLPDYSGNARALYEFIRREHPEYDLTWVVSSGAIADHLKRHGVSAVERVSLQGARAMMRARYIFTTHDGFSLLASSPRQRLINLWHGMPLKALGFAEFPAEDSAARLRSRKRYSEMVSMLISTSEVSKASLVTCFYIDPRRVAITGQPRNDYLFGARDEARRMLESLVYRTLEGKTVIIYLPTFRQATWRADGVPFGNGNRHFLTDEAALSKMEAFLSRENITLVVKMHPLDEARLPTFEQDANICIVRDSAMTDHLVDLYQILGAADVLLTDYSSVHFDFLMLNRPMAFFVPDLAEYETGRGFVLAPYDFWTPGPKSASVMISYLNCVDAYTIRTITDGSDRQC